MKEVQSQAPASGANLGSGFDVISVAYQRPEGDSVIARESNVEGVNLIDIQNTREDLPRDRTNVVVAVAEHLLQAARDNGIETGFKGVDLILLKNMGIGTGAGSSASSSVASAFSVNELLGPNKFDRDSQPMIDAVVHGEYVATSGKPHGDNVLASLNGGFVMIHDSRTYAHAAYKSGNNFYFVVVSPTNVRVNTGEARAALDKLPYDRDNLVKLTAKLLKEGKLDHGIVPMGEVDMGRIVKAGGSEFLVDKYLQGTGYLVQGILNQNPELVGRGMMMDDIITPVRANFIRASRPGINAFLYAREAAMEARALGYTISGSGPSMVGLTDNEDVGHAIGRAVISTLRRNHHVEARFYVTQVDNEGVRRI